MCFPVQTYSYSTEWCITMIYTASHKPEKASFHIHRNFAFAFSERRVKPFISDYLDLNVPIKNSLFLFSQRDQLMIFFHPSFSLSRMSSAMFLLKFIKRTAPNRSFIIDSYHCFVHLSSVTTV